MIALVGLVAWVLAMIGIVLFFASARVDEDETQ